MEGSVGIALEKEEEEIIKQMTLLQERLRIVQSRKDSRVAGTNDSSKENVPDPAASTAPATSEPNMLNKDGSDAERDEQPPDRHDQNMEVTRSRPSPTRQNLTTDERLKLAFGTCASDLDWDTRLSVLQTSLHDFSSPPVTSKDRLDVDTQVSFRGKLCRTKRILAKGRKKVPRSKIEFEILPPPESIQAGLGDSEIVTTQIVVVESKIGSKNFEKIATALHPNDDDDQMVIIKGVVQKKKDSKPFVCVCDPEHHIALIGVRPPRYPVVHAMDGTAITFPMRDNIRRLLGPFTDAWFCPISDSKLSKEQLGQLRCHIAAYRSSGGVIYLGLELKRTESGGFEVENTGINLTRQQLEDLKKTIESSCNNQRPVCQAQEWNSNDSRILPSNIKQRFDECFNSFFTTLDERVNSANYVVRIVVCPSKYPLHLAKEKDIKLHHRLGETSTNYAVEDFVAKMSDTSSEVLKELAKMPSLQNNCTSTIAISNDSTSNALPLWCMCAPEGRNLENKECGECDPINFTIENLPDYCATWLNDSTGGGGTLRIGVSNMPPLATGIWLNERAEGLLKAKLMQRFQGSIDSTQCFCFPPAIEHFTLTKRQIVAPYSALLSKGSKILVLWLEVPPNAGFEAHDKVRQEFYNSWAQKKCPFLTSLFDSTKCGNGHLPLVLPLNVNCLRDVKRPPTAVSFAVGISKPQSIPSTCTLEKVVKDLEKELLKKEASSIKKFVISHQFVDSVDVPNILDPNYCVLDVIVSPSRHDLLYLCQIPKFWKLGSPIDEEGHIGKSPKRMNFQEIVLKCDFNSHAMLYLSTYFQFNDRPILITDIGNHDEEVIAGLARIPWTLVVDFDFQGNSLHSSSKTLRELAQEDPPYIYQIDDLSFNKVSAEDMSDVRPVYWVKALGSPDEITKDRAAWCLSFAPQLTKYLKQACSVITSKVKVVVVWSTDGVSSGFGLAVGDLCLAAQQAQPLNPADVVVVSPAVVSPFLSNFRSRVLPHPPKILSMELPSLSRFLLQTGPSSASIEDISVLWRRVPGNETGNHYSHLLPVETVRNMKAGEIDYLFPEFEDHLGMDDYDDGLTFFEGRTCVRWQDFRAKNVVQRPETDKLYTIVKSRLRNRRDTIVINFRHEPGAGGSTIARHVMWRLRKTFCCVIPSQAYNNLRHDVEELVVASEGRATLVLWDTNLDIDFDALKSRLDGLHVVILRVERFVKLPGSPSQMPGDLLLEEGLSLTVLEAFVSLFSKNNTLRNSCDALELLKFSARRMNDRVPLFLVMVTALENKFVLLYDYVKNRLLNAIENIQRQLLLRIAFARVYTCRSLQERALSADNSWEKSLPSSVQGLIAFDGQYSRRIRFRHHCIDKIVLSELTGIIDDTSSAWGQWLSKFVEDFIRHLAIVYPVPEFDSLGSNEFEIILRRLFHEKADHMQAPYFLSLIGSLAGKQAVLDCMRHVSEVLPPITRMQAHFLADLARVFLHIECRNVKENLKSASDIMMEAHKLLPDDRTLYHQEGQLYFDAMKFSDSVLLSKKEPLKRASEIIELAQQASYLFAKSRKCKLQGRTNALYPWISDVRCYIECLTDICSLMTCSFHTLPRSLTSHTYLQNAWEEVMHLLETLSTEDPFFFNTSCQQMLTLVGTKDKQNKQLKLYLKEIDGIDSLNVEPTIPYPGHSNLQKLALTLRHTTFFLRSLYHSARQVPQNISTRLSLAMIWLIEQPRIVGSVLAHTGHTKRFFELELLWEWSRYSSQPPHLLGMASIIEKYMANIDTHPLLKAKCLMFKGVTRLLQLLCKNDVTVNPATIMGPIDECNAILQNKQLIWKYREFLTEGYGNGLMSSKDWIWTRSLDREVNRDSASLNDEYAPNQHTSFRKFSGHVNYMSFDGRKGGLSCSGVKLFFVPRHAPNTWRVNGGEVKFYISVSSHQGFQAHPEFSPDDANHDNTQSHRWLLNSRTQMGRIKKVDHENELVYFEPPNPTQTYEALAAAKFDDMPLIRYTEGDLFEFAVNKVQMRTGHSYYAYNLRPVTMKEGTSVSLSRQNSKIGSVPKKQEKPHE